MYIKAKMFSSFFYHVDKYMRNGMSQNDTRVWSVSIILGKLFHTSWSVISNVDICRDVPFSFTSD